MSNFPESFLTYLEFIELMEQLFVEKQMVKMLFYMWYLPVLFQSLKGLRSGQHFIVHLDQEQIFEEIINWNRQRHISIEKGLFSNDNFYMLRKLALHTSLLQNTIIDLLRKPTIFDSDNLKYTRYDMYYLVFEKEDFQCYIDSNSNLICVADSNKFNFGKFYISFEYFFPKL